MKHDYGYDVNTTKTAQRRGRNDQGTADTHHRRDCAHRWRRRHLHRMEQDISISAKSTVWNDQEVLDAELKLPDRQTSHQAP